MTVNTDPTYLRGYLDAGTQILASLDRAAAAANNAAPSYAEDLVVEDLLRQVAAEHPDATVSPLPRAVHDMAATLTTIRRLLDERTAAAAPAPTPEAAGHDDGADHAWASARRAAESTVVYNPIADRRALRFLSTAGWQMKRTTPLPALAASDAQGVDDVGHESRVPRARS
jgi:hypothetical protein